MASHEGSGTGKAVLDRNPDKFLSRTVHDLISLKGRTIVITGGGRGLGLAFAFAVAEVGGNIAIIDLLDKPHDHFHKLETEFGVKVKLYKCVLLLKQTNHAHSTHLYNKGCRKY